MSNERKPRLEGDCEGGLQVEGKTLALVGKMGGSSIAFQLATEDGLIPGTRIQKPTWEGVGGRDLLQEREVVQHLAQTIREVVEQALPQKVAYLYLSCTGLFFPDGSLAADEPNIPALKKGFHMQKALQTALGEVFPIHVVHDGTAGAMAECGPYGSIPTCQDFFFVIAGTGIGTRRVLEGRPFFGDERVSYLHNEGPHHLIYCGGEGYPDYEYRALACKGIPQIAKGEESLEMRCQGKAWEKRAQEVFQDPSMNPKKLGQLIKDGEARALQIVKEIGSELGLGLATIDLASNKIFNKYSHAKVVLLGSGLCHFGEPLRLAVEQGWHEAFHRAGVKCETEVRLSSLMEDDTGRELLAGIPGSLALPG